MQANEGARGSIKKSMFHLLFSFFLVGVGVVIGIITRTPHSGTQVSDSSDATVIDTVWTCSMHPAVQQPTPGLCPICAMDLIPLDSNNTGPADERRFTTTPEAAALMRVETAAVERRFVEAEVRMVGEVAYDETRLASITAWVPGRIERMYADFTGTMVRKGDHMVELYSPELLAAKEELQRAEQALAKLSPNAPANLRTTATRTVEAVRSKLKRWGMTPTQIAQAATQGAANDRITIYAPMGGTIIERNGSEGSYVDTGEPIYTIADLDALWVQLEAYETDLPWLHFGQKVHFATESYPGEDFEGTIAFINPTLNRDTRTVDIRVNVPNSNRRLKPGMFVRATVRAQVATGGRVMDPSLAGKWISPMHPEIVKDGPGDCDVCGMALVPAEELGYVSAEAHAEDKPLVIPATAPLITGKRAVVYVEVSGEDTPTYEGREIILGARAGDYYIVQHGLEAGERVVVEGNFKIDSALQIAAKPSMMRIDDVEDVDLDQVTPLIQPYLTLQEALAGDDLAKARGVVQTLVKIESTLMTPSLQASLTAAESMDVLRKQFEVLSNALLKPLGGMPIPFETPLYRVHCPMAFDFTGADWIQAGDDIRNPYFGAEMLACGSVKGSLSLQDTTMSGHEGHDHE